MDNLKVKIDKEYEQKVMINVQIGSNNKIIKKLSLPSGSDIRAFVFHKDDIDSKNIKKIQEKNGSGSIYFLINQIENSIYVGQTKNASQRLSNHEKDNNKEFDQIILLLSKNWTPTILDFLEYWFINFFQNNNIFAKKINNKKETKPITNWQDDDEIKSSLEALKWLLLSEEINISCENDESNIEYINKINIENDSKIVKTKTESKYEKQYKNLNPEMKNLIDFVVRKIHEIDNKIESYTTKTYVAFKTKKIFASFYPNKNEILLWVRLDYNPIEMSKFSNISDVKNIGHFGPGNTEIKISKEEELEEIFFLIKKAYEFSK